MAITVHPRVNTTGLVFYLDVDNKNIKAYTIDNIGSQPITYYGDIVTYEGNELTVNLNNVNQSDYTYIYKSLVSDNTVLSSSNDIISSKLSWDFKNNIFSFSSGLSGIFSQVDKLSSYTIQFWANGYIQDYTPIFTPNITTEFPFLRVGPKNGNSISLSFLVNNINFNISSLGFKCKDIYSYYSGAQTSFVKLKNKLDKTWHLFTITKNHITNKIRIYKNFEYEEFDADIYKDIDLSEIYIQTTIGSLQNTLNLHKVLLYNRAFSTEDIFQNFSFFKSSFRNDTNISTLTSYVDKDAELYFNRVNRSMSSNEKKNISNFITALKGSNLWNDLQDCWLMSSRYNTGSGTVVHALKNSTNNGTMVTNLGPSNLPTWTLSGIGLLNQGDNDIDIAGRIEFPFFTKFFYSKILAPMSIAVAYIPTRSMPNGSCIFGQTSFENYEPTHFGINGPTTYNNELSTTTFYFGSGNNITYAKFDSTDLNKPWFAGMRTDRLSAYAFVNNTEINMGKFLKPVRPLDYPNVFTDVVYITGAAAGYQISKTLKRNFEGYITAAFVFSRDANITDLYNIYKTRLMYDILSYQDYV